MKSSSLRLALLACVTACCRAATTSSFEERVELLFRSPLAEMMALAPDGNHMAYTTQAGSQLQVIILDLRDPRQKITVNVDEAREIAFSADKDRARLRFLRWATANRLVLAPTEERIEMPGGGPPRIIAPIHAVDADGQNAKTLADADDFAVDREQLTLAAATVREDDDRPPRPPVMIPRSPQIMGFEPGNREQLLLRLPAIPRLLPPELVSLNVVTGKMTSLDSSQVRGVNDGRIPAAPALRRQIEQELARKFPQRQIALMDWSEGMEHVLARVTGGGDPGRIFAYQRPFNLVLEISRVAPWLNTKNLHESRYIEFEIPAGVKLSCHLTWPRTPRLKPPPLLVFFPSGFPGGAQPDFDPEAQVFADLGFAVLRLNHRYARGVPASEREAVRTAIDRISVDDAAALIQKVAAQFRDRPFDVKHIAAGGRGFGGYLAVRALQLRPDVFRAGVAIDAPMDLRTWMHPAEGAGARDIPRDIFTGDGVAWDKFSVRASTQTLKQPVFFLVEPLRNPAIDASVGAIRSALKGLKQPAEYLDLDPAFNLALPKTRAAVYRKIEEFFNLRLYDYRVKIGPATEVK